MPFPQALFTHIIHAATQSSVDLNIHNPLVMLDTIVQGTGVRCNLPSSAGPKTFYLPAPGRCMASSRLRSAHLPEDFAGSPDPMSPNSAYGVGGAAAEFICSCHARKYGLESTIARAFAFVGPYLPLDTHFAIGNFIRDRLENRPILVTGDGTPVPLLLICRGYGHLAVDDLLFKGLPCRPYNVGSDRGVSIGEIAKMVGEIADPAIPVQIKQSADLTKPPERYVPATKRSQNELGLREGVGLLRPFAKRLIGT